MVKQDSKKNILLGVTGGIAAYKSCELIRLLTKAGYEVRVVLTPQAAEFVSAKTFQALSANPVGGEFGYEPGYNGMAHIELARWADLILIAPATANSLAKIAQGSADNLLLELVLARSVPLLVAPAMNTKMWENPATQRNITRLRSDGVVFLGPASGDLACGETGAGRMLEAEIIVTLIDAYFTPKLLSGCKVLLTAGATQELIDPVRCLTNLSSGRMGVALARACQNAGAEVTLIYGDLKVDLPYGLKKAVKAVSAAAMAGEVQAAITDQDVFISVAAVADYRVKDYQPQKIKKNVAAATGLTLDLVANPDILAAVASLPQPPFCVGFAAESEEVLATARAKRIKKKIPLIIANDVSATIGQDEAAVYIIGTQGEVTLKKQPKDRIAAAIVQVLASYLQ